MNGIMIQGTSSDSGKSFIVTGLCRLLSDMGINICPFKSQNMSNNAYVTHDGLEISTAQALQAQASRLTPEVFMNPILLKPRHNTSSEIILNGRVFAHSTRHYREFTQNEGIKAVRESLRHIERHFDAVIIEGAGSPAEINLNAHEIVNMRIAREADVDVILVADVDRGGSLASVAGTLELLDSDRERVKGIIYNKFRGNIELFKSAIEWTEHYTGIKVVGVIPYLEGVNLSGEDSLNIRNINRHAEISIGIINFPGISNFGDFDAFIHEPDVNLIYIDDNMRIKDFHELDAIILPGTKNTFASLEWLKASGLDVMIRNFRGLIFGICGGMQIMGRELFDDYHIENDNTNHACGLNLIPSITSFNSQGKITRQAAGFISGTHEEIHGYEIHYGLTHHEYDHDFHPLFTINESPEGITSHDMRIAGTYIHGIFGNDNFRSLWLNGIRRKKNYGTRSPHTVKKDSYDEIASVLAHNLDIDFILKLILHEDTMLQPE